MSEPMRVMVCGSLVMDLVVRVPRYPRIGETVLGTSLETYPGGKGFNQAVAAARLGAATRLIGCIGTDAFGDTFLAELEREGIPTCDLRRDETGTGVAVPIVNDAGENSIVMVPRANMRLTAEDVERAEKALLEASAVLLQLEVPVEASLAAARLARAGAAPVIWNLAPYGELPQGALGAVDVVVVNEAEAAGLLGKAPASPAEALQAAHAIRMLGARAVVITLGSLGAVYEGASGAGHVPGYQVNAIDTVGAGDAFCGALGWSLARGEEMGDAVRFANAAGAASTTVRGAGPAMPDQARVTQLLEEVGDDDLR